MKASVVLPAYNAARFLRPAIESILAQTFEDFEFIILDDCSKDDTWALIQEYAARDARIVPLRNERNLNLANTLNRGIAASRGEYIIRMDHDDISVPRRIEKQVAFLDAHPEVGIVGGSMEIINEQDRRIGLREYHLTDEAIRKHIFLYSPFCHPATAIRRSVLERIGGYRHEFNPAEDYELYFRIGTCARFANLDEVVIRYRVVQGTSMTTGGTRRLERKTIEVRRQYARSGVYRMTWRDRLYNALHFASLYLVSSRLKSWIFAKLRNT
jgi:glycosyltransferase involved in cell wall biosynthesis